MKEQEIKPVPRATTSAEWEPFAALTRMRDNMELMFSDLFRNISHTEPGILATWTPALDLYKTADTLVAEVAVPGMKSEELEINVTQDQLTVTGEYKRNEEKKTEHMYRSEFATGRFQRAVRLPYPVRSDGVTAKLEEGILRIKMPLMQPEVHKSTKVKVE